MADAESGARERTARGGQQAARGHRGVPHTGDLCIEAWAPTREECVAEAVGGAVASFADIPAESPGIERECVLAGATDERLLVCALEEIVYRMEAHGELPASVAVEPAGDGLRMRLTMTGCAMATQIGAVPKAVSLHGLRLARESCGWVCRVTLDV